MLSSLNNVSKIAKPLLTIGTIGHFEHGKTCLTSAIVKLLSGPNSDNYRKCEELRTPAEIQSRAFEVEYETANRRYVHIDCPGHAEYIPEMIDRAAYMEGAILVVDAAEGIMPQTKEHLHVMRQFGIPPDNIVVFMNKTDESPWPNTLQPQIQELLNEHDFPGDTTNMISGSALCTLKGRKPKIGEQSIKQLIDVLDSFVIPEASLFSKSLKEEYLVFSQWSDLELDDPFGTSVKQISYARYLKHYHEKRPK